MKQYLVKIATLEELLRGSNASKSFKEAVENFAKGKDSELIQYSMGSPKIKVLRVLQKLFETFPGKPITNVVIDGYSSCSAFTGTLEFAPDQTKVRFNWDCSWRAAQEGLKTWYGQSDQIKAAQLFGYQCFEIFEIEE